MDKAISLALLLASAAVAQDPIAELTKQPSINRWQAAHPKSELHLYRYFDQWSIDVGHDNQYCAASVLEGTTAYFYIPAVTAGSLPPLPDPSQVHLRTDCKLKAIWYDSASSEDALIRDFTAKWGAPNGSRAKPDVVGWLLWTNLVAWHRNGISVWVASTPKVVVYARRDLPTDEWQPPDPALIPIDSEAARIVDAPTPLAKAIQNHNRCQAATLAQWLDFAKTLPAERRAAALLLAHSYAPCVHEIARLKKLGATFIINCPQDGPDYSGNFRDQAEQLGGETEAGQLAQLSKLQRFCSFVGKTPWPEALAAKANAFLAQFPNSNSLPVVHFILARAHDIRLSYSYPNSNIDGYDIKLSPAQRQLERQAAVDNFGIFLTALPNSPQAPFAWREAWRLMAGLQPTHLYFGCGCE